MSLDTNFSNDWRVSDKQFKMITDKVSNLSKKEAGMLIKFIELLYSERMNYKKND